MAEGAGVALLWAFLGVVAALPVFGVLSFVDVRRRRARGEAGGISSGALMGMDEVWHPSGREARMLWDAQQIVPAPAPVPGDGPGVIAGNRITLEV